MATRWGIASAGKISSDFSAALKVYPTSQHRVVAVAARNIDDAKKFADRFGIEKAYGSYAELAKDPEIDVVYIGAIHPQHLPLATMMLEAGKHVLCEKPLCMNVKQTKQLLQVAKEQKRFLMEGAWPRFFPAYKEVHRRIKAGEIGDVRHVLANFGRDLMHIPKVVEKEMGGGATLDIGFYPIQFASFIMGAEKPLKIIAGGQMTPGGVDESLGATLLYSGGRIATLAASIRSDLPSEAFVVGSKGTIKVNFPMWCPESIESPSGTFCEPLPKTEQTFYYDNSQGLMYEAEEVRRCIKEGLLESPGIPHSETLTLAEILEQVRKQVGTEYPQDH